MTVEEAPGYTELLRRNADYRRLWVGQVISFFGDWFKHIALYTTVQELTGSAQAVAAVLVASLLPIFAVMPIAGPLVDRVDRRKVLLATDIARAICALGLAAAHRAGSLPALFTILVIMVGFSGIFIPARTSVIPQLTAPEELPVAMALSGGTWSVMLALGAAAGGLVTAALGVTWSFLLDSCTYLLSAAVLWGLPALLPGEGAKGRTGFSDGLRYLARRPYLSAVLMLKGAIGLANGVVAMLPIYGNGLLPATAGPLWIGLIYTFRGVGAFIGSMGARRLTGDRPEVLRRWIAPAFALTTAAYIGLSGAPNIWVASLCCMMGAVGTGVVWVFAGILGQMASDQAYRGRLFALEFGMMTLTAATAAWVGGALVDWTTLGPRDVVLGSAFVLLLPAVGWTIAMATLRPTGAGRSE